MTKESASFHEAMLPKRVKWVCKTWHMQSIAYEDNMPVEAKFG